MSWSRALRPEGIKLAYCPTDARGLRFYMSELLELDDLFVLCFHTIRSPQDTLHDPDASGWVCGSHSAFLHRETILD